MNLLLPQLISIQTLETKALKDTCETLLKLSHSTSVKTILCKKSLLTEIITQLSSCSKNNDIILSNLRVIFNCATTALGKVYLRVYHAIDNLICFFDSNDHNILHVTIKVISNILCSSKARVNYFQLVNQHLIQLLSHSDSQIQMTAAMAIHNLAFDNAIQLSKAVLPLISQLNSEDTKVLTSSLHALLNFCSGKFQKKKPPNLNFYLFFNF